MKQLPVLFIIVLLFAITACTAYQPTETAATDSVAANIKMYTHVWDEIINHGKLDLFNDSNFTKDVVMHENPDKVGIDSARVYYANYLTGFSDIKFTIKDVFGQGNKIVKYWNFSGTHTGMFLAYRQPAKRSALQALL